MGDKEPLGGANPRLDPDDANILYTAAVVGAPELALQLERLGISAPEESLEDARHLRRDLLQTVERMRCDGDLEPDG